MQNYKLLPNEKLKRNRLKEKADFQGNILGIRTVLPGYRLSYFLNKQLNLSFQKQNQSPASTSDDNQNLYTFYSAEQSGHALRFFLLPNKLNEEGQYLIPRYKQIDFIFVIENTDHEIDTTSYLEALKGIDSIEAAFEISHDIFKPEKFLNLD